MRMLKRENEEGSLLSKAVVLLLVLWWKNSVYRKGVGRGEEETALAHSLTTANNFQTILWKQPFQSSLCTKRIFVLLLLLLWLFNMKGATNITLGGVVVGVVHSPPLTCSEWMFLTFLKQNLVSLFSSEAWFAGTKQTNWTPSSKHCYFQTLWQVAGSFLTLQSLKQLRLLTASLAPPSSPKASSEDDWRDTRQHSQVPSLSLCYCIGMSNYGLPIFPYTPTVFFFLAPRSVPIS